MLKTFCHDQVKLLLERMDSNPEEFLHHHKWNPFLPNMHHVTKGTADYFESFTPIERALVARKFDRMCRKQMREHAYNRILEVAIAGEDKHRGHDPKADRFHNYETISLNTIAVNALANTITIGKQTLTEQDIKKMKRDKFWGLL